MRRKRSKLPSSAPALFTEKTAAKELDKRSESQLSDQGEAEKRADARQTKCDQIIIPHVNEI